MLKNKWQGFVNKSLTFLVGWQALFIPLLQKFVVFSFTGLVLKIAQILFA